MLKQLRYKNAAAGLLSSRVLLYSRKQKREKQGRVMKRFRNISTGLTLVLAVSFLFICLLFSFSLSHLYGELSRQRQQELSQAAAQAAANHTATLYRQAKALASSCANAPVAGR